MVSMLGPCVILRLFSLASAPAVKKRNQLNRNVKKEFIRKIKPLRDAISRAHLGNGEEEEEDTTLGREQQEI